MPASGCQRLNMKRFVLVLLCGLGMCGAHAQVRVEVLTDQETFLPHERINLAVRITNFSGQDLMLGEDDEWLTFGVQARDGFIVPKIEEVPVKLPFLVKTSEVGTRRLNLAPYYDLSKPARYRVVANVRIPGWNQSFQSTPKDFDIMTGTVIWEEEFGFPGSGKDGSAPEVRKYALMRSTQAKVTRLYFRLTDTSGRLVYRVYPIGNLVSFGNPDRQIDSESRLHVLHQYGARVFNYCVLSPDGDWLKREDYEITESRPTLRGVEGGLVEVVGGLARFVPKEAPVAPVISALPQENGVPPPPAKDPGERDLRKKDSKTSKPEKSKKKTRNP